MIKKKYLITTVQIITLLCLLACNRTDINVKKSFFDSNEASGSLDNMQPKVLSFPINNEDANKIGFVEMENDISIGITSLCIVDHFIYLTDEYHKNIKRVDILTSDIISSSKLTDSTYFKQFNDIVDFNNNLYITSSENNVFVVTEDLKKSFSFKLPTKGGYPIKILSKSDSTLDFCIEVRDSLYSINKKNKIVSSRKLDNKESIWLTNYFDIALGNIRYKSLKYIKENNNEYLIVGGKKIKLIEPFKYCSDAYNIDFNNDYLVIFDISAKEFKLYVYALENKGMGDL
jgi:hypothetical protein